MTVDGTRDILGLWAGEHGDGEGAKYWLRVLSELKNRGAQDVLIVVCVTVSSIYPTRSNRCGHRPSCTLVWSTLRNTYACASRKDWAEITKDLKPLSPPSTACREVPRYRLGSPPTRLLVISSGMASVPLALMSFAGVAAETRWHRPTADRSTA